MNLSAYDADREEVIKRAHDASVAMISVGTQLDTSKAAVALAHEHEDMYATVGVHPMDISASQHADLDAYRELAKDPKVVAIGECGLDYYRLDEGTVKDQRQAFESMIDLADEARKPLMLHLRNGGAASKGGASAYADAYEMLKDRAEVKCNIHFFTGSVEEAKLFLDLGHTFSFTGVITFARDYDEVIRYLPLERIMSETDCPYVAPMPYRGKRNEPAYVVEVVKSIAKIRGEDEEAVRRQLMENAAAFVKLR